MLLSILNNRWQHRWRRVTQISSASILNKHVIIPLNITDERQIVTVENFNNIITKLICKAPGVFFKYLQVQKLTCKANWNIMRQILFYFFWTRKRKKLFFSNQSNHNMSVCLSVWLLVCLSVCFYNLILLFLRFSWSWNVKIKVW
jgi:hypothetical protein